MSRRVKEFVDIANHLSIDEIIEKLKHVQAQLPDDSEAELRVRGDEVFGHRISMGILVEGS